MTYDKIDMMIQEWNDFCKWNKLPLIDATEYLHEAYAMLDDQNYVDQNLTRELIEFTEDFIVRWDKACSEVWAEEERLADQASKRKQRGG